MLTIDLSDPKVAILTPEGALNTSDLDALEKAVDGSINTHDVVPSLVIMLDAVPHWESVAAMARHFHFVSVHKKVIPKVAVVGSGVFAAMMPGIADAFTKTRVRHFPADKAEQAVAWATAQGDDPGRFEEIEGLPRDVVAVRLVGVITAEDYDKTLIPMIEARLEDREAVKMLVVMDDDYAGYSPDAAWADAKFGLGHVRNFKRIALVTDIGWVRRAAKLFAPLWDVDSRLFDVADLEEAKAWVKR
ncbi:SpoIIAA family protein [Sphingomicrobium arenosum]|uniref:STAS/SEC14 domain-containing protein n=1 Tax=Sphingomicrobium arenosum TaxID=2233861 RepID=UPI002240EC96|nr:STAS/SEC14 domain-containing protein [Sphingomicrobium arenosum]